MVKVACMFLNTKAAHKFTAVNKAFLKKMSFKHILKPSYGWIDIVLFSFMSYDIEKDICTHRPIKYFVMYISDKLYYICIEMRMRESPNNRYWKILPVFHFLSFR